MRWTEDAAKADRQPGRHRLRSDLAPVAWAILLVMGLTGGAGAAGSDGLGGPDGSAAPGLTVGGTLETQLFGVIDASEVQSGILTTLRLRADLPAANGVSAHAEASAAAAGLPSIATTVSGGGTGGTGTTGWTPAQLTRASLDRLYLKVEHGTYEGIIGRQRISWGGGLAFAPADYFNPPNPLDPQGPRAGVDGLIIRDNLGDMTYATLAAAFVDRSSGGSSLSGASMLSAGSLGLVGLNQLGTAASATGPMGGLSMGFKFGTHLGTTDIGMSTGYDAPNADHVIALEAKGDLGVGWQAAVVRRTGAEGETQLATMMGLDYSFGGKWLTNLEYQATSASGSAGSTGSDAGRMWYGGVTYVIDETASFGLNDLYLPDLAQQTLVARYSQQLANNLDIDLAATVPLGQSDSALKIGLVQVNVKYSF